MAQARPGDRVLVHYVGSLVDGTQFDSSHDREPLEFTIGQGEMVGGFEQGVICMEPRQSKTVKVPADQAYGPHQPELVIEVDPSELPPGEEPLIGTRVQGTTEPEGRRVELVVVGFRGSSVILDGNHPLAGQDLTFEITLLEIS